MSKDVIRPLMKAVADLPDHFTGLLLQITNKLRCPDASNVAEKLVEAITHPDNWHGITLNSKPYRLHKGDRMLFRKIDGVIMIQSDHSDSGCQCCWYGGDTVLSNIIIQNGNSPHNNFFAAFMIATVVAQTHGLSVEHINRDNAYCYTFRFE